MLRSRSRQFVFMCLSCSLSRDVCICNCCLYNRIGFPIDLCICMNPIKCNIGEGQMFIMCRLDYFAVINWYKLQYECISVLQVTATCTKMLWKRMNDPCLNSLRLAVAFSCAVLFAALFYAWQEGERTDRDF